MGSPLPSVGDLLFEIGMAEVPARFLPGMAGQLAARVSRALADLSLDFTGVVTYGAPRRVAVVVRDLALHQPDRVQEVRGPALKAAFGPDGAPSKAAQGFARAQGVGVEELVVRGVNGAEYVYALRSQPGRPTVELLPGMFAGLLGAMQFPRNMRWGANDFTFVRPIRWLLCLLDGQPLRVDVPGLPSGLSEPLGASRGHRFLAPGPVQVRSAASYLVELRCAGVIADPAERKRTIVDGAARLAEEAGGVVDLRPELLEELTWLSEHPTPVLGRFDPDNLVLPEPVLVTVMQHHQRFAPVRAGLGGRLLPCFIGVRDGDAGHLAVVRAGYETVLRARLADARFFFAEDRKHKLAEHRPELQELMYQEKLGSMEAKARRLERLAAEVARLLGLEPPVIAAARRAAALAKCDLVTQVVRELPELQGTMGGEYARLDGEPEAVASAIAEHYLPSGEGSASPATPAGLALAVADKLDALVGHFWAGIRPTGSQDPYGLRRAAQGIISGLLAQGRDLDLTSAVDAAALILGAEGYAGPALAAASAEVKELLRARLQATLTEAGSAFDEVECVLASTGLGVCPVTLAAAAAALRQVRSEAWFRSVCAAAVRSSGLGGKAAQSLGLGAHEAMPAVDEGAFESEAEQALHDALRAARAAGELALAAGDYAGYWQALVPLAGPVDRFFDGVLVMAPDETVRRNRLSLCHLAHTTFARAGDLSRLVWPGEQQ